MFAKDSLLAPVIQPPTTRFTIEELISYKRSFVPNNVNASMMKIIINYIKFKYIHCKYNAFSWLFQ